MYRSYRLYMNIIYVLYMYMYIYPRRESALLVDQRGAAYEVRHR